MSLMGSSGSWKSSCQSDLESLQGPRERGWTMQDGLYPSALSSLPATADFNLSGDAPPADYNI